MELSLTALRNRYSANDHVTRHSWAAFMDDHNLAIQRIHKTLSDKDAKTIPVCRYSLRLGMFDGELIRVLNRT